ncbi:hypothetical protein BN874_220046 [Candidatus Contendobacter odensis Run_B_J11]|uniref:Uncharacterized protein n=1 Tax=Candidatus Contendobacter odensis Run_B_J11 TaxID=1400861 RepID=A0A7U7J4I3_9GAMM|nr:hypothetical protein BN874_220046 [Candidatus Contendobacter odensis Run_B_J11]
MARYSFRPTDFTWPRAFLSFQHLIAVFHNIKRRGHRFKPPTPGILFCIATKIHLWCHYYVVGEASPSVKSNGLSTKIQSDAVRSLMVRTQRQRDKEQY